MCRHEFKKNAIGSAHAMFWTLGCLYRQNKNGYHNH